MALPQPVEVGARAVRSYCTGVRRGPVSTSITNAGCWVRVSLVVYKSIVICGRTSLERQRKNACSIAVICMRGTQTWGQIVTLNNGEGRLKSTLPNPNYYRLSKYQDNNLIINKLL